MELGPQSGLILSNMPYQAIKRDNRVFRVTLHGSFIYAFLPAVSTNWLPSFLLLFDIRSEL